MSITRGGAGCRPVAEDMPAGPAVSALLTDNASHISLTARSCSPSSPLRRDRSSMAITGEGLAMAGVGYDLPSLSVPKFGTTTTNPKKLKKKATKRALAEKAEKEELEEEEGKKMKVTSDASSDTDVVA